MEEQFIRITETGSKYYYKDSGLTILHRTDGPAIEYDNGDKFWYINGLLHRSSGPAVELADGTKEWWVDGVQYTEEEFNALSVTTRLTLDEIANRIGITLADLIQIFKDSGV